MLLKMRGPIAALLLLSFFQAPLLALADPVAPVSPAARNRRQRKPQAYYDAVVQLKNLEERDAILEATCVDADGGVREIEAFDCVAALDDQEKHRDELLEVIRSSESASKVESKAAKEPPCPPPPSAPILDASAAAAMRVANKVEEQADTAASCPGAAQPMYSASCGKEVASEAANFVLDAVTLGMAADSKAPPSCFNEVLRGAYLALTSTLGLAWDLAKEGGKWAYGKISSLWLPTNKLEDESGDKAAVLSGLTDEEADKAKADPRGFFTKFGEKMYNTIMDGIRDNFMCGEWDFPSSGGPSSPAQTGATLPGIGLKCVAPLKEWSCATCQQLTRAVCGVSGYLGGMVVESAMLGVMMKPAALFYNLSKAKFAAAGARVAEVFPNAAARVVKAKDVAVAIGNGAKALPAKAAEGIAKGAGAVAEGVSKIGKSAYQALVPRLQVLEHSRAMQALLRHRKLVKAGQVVGKAVGGAILHAPKAVYRVGKGLGDVAYMSTWPVRRYSQLLKEAFEAGFESTEALKSFQAAKAARAEKVSEMERQLSRAKPLAGKERAALENEMLAQDIGGLDPVEARARERSLEKAGFSHAEITKLRSRGYLPAEVREPLRPARFVAERELTRMPIDQSTVKAMIEGEEIQYIIDHADKLHKIGKSVSLRTDVITMGVDGERFMVKQVGKMRWDPKLEKVTMTPTSGFELSEKEAVKALEGLEDAAGKGRVAATAEDLGSSRARILDCLDILGTQRRGESALGKKLIWSNVVNTIVIGGRDALKEEKDRSYSTENGRSMVLGDYITNNVGTTVSTAIAQSLTDAKVNPVAAFVARAGASTAQNLYMSRPVYRAVVVPKKIDPEEAKRDPAKVKAEAQFAERLGDFNLGHMAFRIAVNPTIDKIFSEQLPLWAIDKCRKGGTVSIVLSDNALRLYEQVGSTGFYYTLRTLIIGQ